MNNCYCYGGSIYTDDNTFRQYGGVNRHESGSESVTIDLQFRMTTNGVIVNTLVNDEPVITTSAGTFH